MSVFLNSVYSISKMPLFFIRIFSQSMQLLRLGTKKTGFAVKETCL